MEDLKPKIAGLMVPCEGYKPQIIYDWSPIETAPKDGSRFIGFDGEVISITSFVNWCGGIWEMESEISDDGHGSYHPSWKPTHWMPLPAPPGSD